MLRRLIALHALALAACLCSSCGNGQKPVYPVHGRVLYNGKPAEHAIVVFHPRDEAEGEPVKPRGKVGADGSFTLTTYQGNDGAPVGEYRVTVELWLSSARGDEGPTSRLPPRYARPETSGLTATINAGSTELTTFEIKR
jgi:hypothetical protein